MRTISTFFGLALALALVGPVKARASSAEHHFFDADDKALASLDPVWRALEKEFGEFAPARIVVHVTDDQFLRFVVRHDSVKFAIKHYDSRPCKPSLSRRRTLPFID